MDASKFLVDFFKGLSPEIKLDLFNASIELLRASITPQPETASPGGIVGTQNTQRDFVLNTPEKIKEQLDQHPIIREMENYLSVTTPHVELPEIAEYEAIPKLHGNYYAVEYPFIQSDFDKGTKPHLLEQWQMGLVINQSNANNT